MSTRSRIGILNEDGSVTSIYCHNDGYPEGRFGVGRTLLAHYSDPAKLRQLIALGDLSALRPAISPPPGAKHSFESPLPGITIAYGRDRSERHTNPITSPGEHLFWPLITAEDSWIDYGYLLRNSDWFCGAQLGSWRVVPLASLLTQEGA